MRAQLLHLSGPMRGRTVTYPERVVRVGSDEQCEARMIANVIEPQHAQIEWVEAECRFHLRRLEGSVFVNGTEIEEVILRDGDQLEFGAGGPMARFRTYVPIGAVCKPVRRMIADAADVARHSGGRAATRMLTKDMFTQATPTLKVGFPLIVVASVLLIGWWGGAWFSSRPTLDLQRKVERLTADSVRKSEVDELHAQFEVERKQMLAELDKLKKANEQAHQTVRRIQTVYPRGVCLIHGIYRIKEKDGTWMLDTRGAPLEVQYTGSGFLATPEGHVVTNRHVALPWLEESGMDAMIASGVEPVFQHFTATFPGRASIDIAQDTIRRREDDLDVAVFKLAKNEVEGVPVLPLEQLDRTASHRAIVLGYPTGLKALLARANSEARDQLIQNAATMVEAIEELAKARQISPVITDGIVSNVEAHLIAYDASTTHGGSGGPVIGDSGEVIAVNFAIQRHFGANNLGVPIRYARELLPE